MVTNHDAQVPAIMHTVVIRRAHSNRQHAHGCEATCALVACGVASEQAVGSSI